MLLVHISTSSDRDWLTQLQKKNNGDHNTKEQYRPGRIGLRPCRGIGSAIMVSIELLRRRQLDQNGGSVIRTAAA